MHTPLIQQSMRAHWLEFPIYDQEYCGKSTADIGYDSIDTVTALGEVLTAVFDVLYLHVDCSHVVRTYARTYARMYVACVLRVTGLIAYGWTLKTL